MRASRCCELSVTLSIAALALLSAACSAPSAPGEFEWARAALARNPDLEVISSDEHARIFTVKSRSQGTLYTVKADDVVGVPKGLLAAVAAASAPPAEAASGGTLPPQDAATASGGNESSAPPADERARPDYTVEREAGRVRVTGPGVSITTSATAAAAGAAAPAPAKEPASASSGAEHRSEPLVCQGAKFLRLDNRNIEFTGDAVLAEKGCELYITNSRLIAAGTGVSAAGALVHIDNSTVEGRTASIEAEQGAKVYVAGSKLRGISRRFDVAELHDLGGNEWH
jgi:hypothetical protein